MGGGRDAEGQGKRWGTLWLLLGWGEYELHPLIGLAPSVRHPGGVMSSSRDLASRPSVTSFRDISLPHPLPFRLCCDEPCLFPRAHLDLSQLISLMVTVNSSRHTAWWPCSMVIPTARQRAAVPLEQDTDSRYPHPTPQLEAASARRSFFLSRWVRMGISDGSSDGSKSEGSKDSLGSGHCLSVCSRNRCKLMSR